MTTRMVPGFLPSTPRFAFANAFPHVLVRRIGIPGIVSVPIGDAAKRPARGMAFAARDYFEAQMPPPTTTTPPAEGELFDTFGVRATDFDIDETMQDTLFKSGRRVAEAFLKTWDFEAYVETYHSGAVMDVPGLVDGTS
jgi:hypothetical protein